MNIFTDIVKIQYGRTSALLIHNADQPTHSHEWDFSCIEQAMLWILLEYCAEGFHLISRGIMFFSHGKAMRLSTGLTVEG
jgi:hypothetical protein